MREPDERIGAGVGPGDPGARAWKLGGLGEILSVASAGEARLPAPIGDGREQATR
jgi:hypothetical protein